MVLDIRGDSCRARDAARIVAFIEEEGEQLVYRVAERLRRSSGYVRSLVEETPELEMHGEAHLVRDRIVGLGIGWKASEG